MYCDNCGMELKDHEKFCSNCGKRVREGVDNSNFSNATQGKNSLEKYGFNGLLVWSIIELICCSRIFGLIALILLCVQLKPAAERGDFAEADKSKSLIKILLIVGIVSGVLLNLIVFWAQLVPVVLDMFDVL